jgi:hypothetical protein
MKGSACVVDTVVWYAILTVRGTFLTPDRVGLSCSIPVGPSKRHLLRPQSEACQDVLCGRDV